MKAEGDSIRMQSHVIMFIIKHSLKVLNVFILNIFIYIISASYYLYHDRLEEYQINKSTPIDPQQPSVSQFMETHVGLYSASHPQQRAITNSILSDLVIDCSLPLSIVENKSFLSLSG